MTNKIRKEILINYDRHKIYCEINGQGDELLIAFPGYGSTTEYYAPALPLLAKKFTTWVIDLPLHGETTWNKSMFTISDFTAIIQLILQRTGHLKFNLLGHSFGGRAVLTQIPFFGAQLDRVILLAPDGIINPGLMTVSWIPPWFRRITSGWIDHSHRLLPFAKFLYDRKWLASSAYRFAMFYLKTNKRRQQVKMYWLSLAGFQVNLPSVKKNIEEHQIKTFVILGKKDKIIPSDVGNILKSGIEPWVENIIADTGHLLKGGAVLNLIEL